MGLHGLRGEIRDRLAGGQGSLPLAGTAVYMTPYSRVKGDRKWEEGFPKEIGCIKPRWIC